jgi:peptide/nickel transport system permease protein
MISDGRGDLRNSPYIVFIPSIALFFTVLSLNYLGDVVRARFEVRESML